MLYAFNYYQFLFWQQSLVLLIIYLLVYSFSILALLILFSNKFTETNNTIKTLKNLITNKKYYYYLLIVFSSLIGIPPFGGFVLKLSLSFFVLINYNMILFFFFFVIILFNVLFYLQVLKLIKRNDIKNYSIIRASSEFKLDSGNNFYFLNFFLLNFFLFFLFFFIFFFKDFLFLFL